MAEASNWTLNIQGEMMFKGPWSHDTAAALEEEVEQGQWLAGQIPAMQGLDLAYGLHIWHVLAHPLVMTG